ncbi:MAG: hypothetical protein ACQ9MH_12510 [Nitrospinales bacterium]
MLLKKIMNTKLTISKNALLFIFVLAFTLIFTTSDLYACSCFDSKLPVNHYRADMIVLGTVSKIEQRTKNEELPFCEFVKEGTYRFQGEFHSCKEPAWWKGKYVTLKIDQSWKQKDVSSIEVVDVLGSECNWDFKEGDRYLVYLRKSQVGVSTGLCVGNREEKNINLDLVYLDTIEKKNSPAETLQRIANYLNENDASLNPSFPDQQPPSKGIEIERILKTLSAKPLPEDRSSKENTALTIIKYLVGHNLPMEYALHEEFRALSKKDQSLDKESSNQLKRILLFSLATSRLKETQENIYPDLLEELAKGTDQEVMHVVYAFTELLSPGKVIPKLREYLKQSDNPQLQRRAQGILNYYRIRANPTAGH